MPLRVTVSPIESISSRSTVCHVDELSEEAKSYFFRIVREDVPVAVESHVATEFSRWDVVKFTDYYRVSVTNSRTSDHVTA